MKVRWWRVGVIFEREGRPYTQTLHVRAFDEVSALRLVAQRIGVRHHVYIAQPSEPLLRVKEVEEIVATYGPYERSWDDPDVGAWRVRFEAEPRP